MKLSINQNDLLNTLQKIQGPTSFKQNFPILNSILLETHSQKLKCTSTDLDTTIISYCDCHITQEGKIAVPAKRFIPIIRELPHEEITLEILKNNLLIRCGKIEFKINCLPATEFPVIEEEARKVLIKVSAADLMEMIRFTSFCVGFEDVNYVLNGILFELYEDTISLVSTDGKRLACIKRKLPTTQSEIKTKISFIFPLKSITELAKLIKDIDDEVYIYVEKGNVGFDLKGTLFISKPIEGDFPNYSQYIPEPSKNKLHLKRKEFLASLRRAELLSIPDHLGVKLELKKEEVMINKSTPQLGEIKENIPAQYTGPRIEVGFNPTYLIDVLKNIEVEDIEFEIYDVDKPAVLRLEDYIYLVLPMKL